jgi:hypothetical protein
MEHSWFLDFYFPNFTSRLIMNSDLSTILLYLSFACVGRVRCGGNVDYTDNPSTNLLPGDVNMAKLREMYLTRRLTRVEEDGTVVQTTELIKR